MASILATAHIRIARPTNDFAATKHFYCDGLGFDRTMHFMLCAASKGCFTGPAEHERLNITSSTSSPAVPAHHSTWRTWPEYPSYHDNDTTRAGEVHPTKVRHNSRTHRILRQTISAYKSIFRKSKEYVDALLETRLTRFNAHPETWHLLVQLRSGEVYLLVHPDYHPLLHVALAHRRAGR